MGDCGHAEMGFLLKFSGYDSVGFVTLGFWVPLAKLKGRCLPLEGTIPQRRLLLLERKFWGAFF